MLSARAARGAKAHAPDGRGDDGADAGRAAADHPEERTASSAEKNGALKDIAAVIAPQGASIASSRIVLGGRFSLLMEVVPPRGEDGAGGGGGAAAAGRAGGRCYREMLARRV